MFHRMTRHRRATQGKKTQKLLIKTAILICIRVVISCSKNTFTTIPFTIIICLIISFALYWIIPACNCYNFLPGFVRYSNARFKFHATHNAMSVRTLYASDAKEAQAETLSLLRCVFCVRQKPNLSCHIYLSFQSHHSRHSVTP